MKNILLLLNAAFFLLHSSCKKNPIVPIQIPLTVTSISPSHVFPEEEVTITGTGFNPDPTKNEVFFMIDYPAVITAASDTTLKVITPPRAILGLQSSSTIRIKANGKELETTDVVTFKLHLSITSVSHSFGGNSSNINIPGDSVIITGQGFSASPEKNIVTYAGKRLIVAKVDSSYIGTLRCFYPSDACISGVSEPDTTTQEVELNIKTEGQTAVWQKRVQIFPLVTTMQYVSHTPPTNTGYVFFYLRHKNILPGTRMIIRRINLPPNTPPNESDAALNAEYTDEVKVRDLFWLASSTPPGTYRIIIYRQNRIYLTKDIVITS